MVRSHAIFSGGQEPGVLEAWTEHRSECHGHEGYPGCMFGWEGFSFCLESVAP